MSLTTAGGAIYRLLRSFRDAQTFERLFDDDYIKEHPDWADEFNDLGTRGIHSPLLICQFPVGSPMHVDPPTDGPTLPTLDRGVYVLDADDRGTGPLQSLVLDHLLMNDGPALWVDSRGNATTQPLARLAPSDRLLDRIQVARGFTPFQHYSLVKTLPDHWTDETALIVLPEVDWFYRQDDLARGEGAELFAAGVATIRNLVDGTDVPVLATRTAADELTAPLTDLATECIRCKRTQFGPRFVGDAFETLVYQERGYVQTTLAFWERVLAARHEASQSPTPREVSNVGAY